MRKLFFKDLDDEFCFEIDDIKEYMRDNNLNELTVYKAIPDIIGGGIFWCKKHRFCGDGTADYCGRENCEDYEPRNKISGVCKHHRHVLYVPGEKVTIKL